MLALALAVPASAGAHAVVERTDPPRNATVAELPHAVTFDFNEPVEAAFGSIRVYDSDGRRVDEGPIERPPRGRDVVSVHMRPDAGPGVYTATFRVVSADGHPVEGGFSFGVGVSLTAPGGPRPPQVAKLLAGSEPRASVEAVYGIARGLHYLALLVLIGACVFAWRIATPPRRLVALACAAGLLSALAAVPLQGLLGSAGPLTDALAGATIAGSLDTRTGAAWAIRAGTWALALALALAPVRWRASALALPAAALALSMPLAGHAWTQSPRALLVAADLVHVLAAGAWLGALVLLVARRDARRDEIRAFSAIALPAVAALAAAGGVQAWFYLSRPGDLVGDPYGVVLLAKVALLAAIVVLAARNRRALARPAGPSLRAAMRAEVALALVVVAATAVLVRLAPPAAAAAGPVYRDVDLGPLRLQMVIEPQKVGANVAHLYFYDRATGEQFDRMEELTLRLTQPDRGIGPIVARVPRASFAHYELRGLTVGVPGTWRIRVEARVSDFDLYTGETTVSFDR